MNITIDVVSTHYKQVCEPISSFKYEKKFSSVMLQITLNFYYRVVAPKKARLNEAMTSLRAKQESLAMAQTRVAELQAVLDRLQADFEAKLVVKEDLRQKVS